MTALELLVEGQKDDPETWSLVRDIARKEDETSIRAKAIAFLTTDQNNISEVRKLVPELLGSIEERHRRRQTLREIDSKMSLVSNPIMSVLLYGSWSHYYGFESYPFGLVLDFDPLEPVAGDRIKKLSSLLKRPDAELRKLYEELAEALYAKLGIELILEWKATAGP